VASIYAVGSKGTVKSSMISKFIWDKIANLAFLFFLYAGFLFGILNVIRR
jgi:hypothetical protein